MSKQAIYFTFLLTLILSSISCQTSPSQPPTPSYDHNFSGTYRYDFGEDGGCLLKVIHRLAMAAFDELDFELSCNRGAPSYNLGYAADTILFERSSSQMAVWSSPYGDCHLVFEFSTTNVVVSQIGYAADCGFGGSVYANGDYQLEDSAVPQLGCMEPSNPCE